MHYRGFHDILPGARHHLDTSPLPRPSIRRSFDFRRSLKAYDDKIAYLTDGCDFILYTPHVRTQTYRAASLHPRCQRVVYLEEGTDSFLPRHQDGTDGGGPLPGRASKRVIIAAASYGFRGMRLNHLLNRSYVAPRTSQYFCLSDDAFRWAKNRSIVSPEVHELDIDADELMLVLSPLHQGNRTVPFDSLIYGLRALPSLAEARGYRSVAVKFHIENKHSAKDRQLVLEALRVDDVIKARVLPDSLLLERYLKGVRAIGTNSSALHYARILGGESYTMGSLLDDKGRSWLSDCVRATSLLRIPDIVELPTVKRA